MNEIRKILVSAAVVLLLAFTASGQTAAAVKCGAVITSSMTLTGNLHCPGLAANGAALTVVASGVTIDLNGYTISGSGAGYGILVPGPDKVTIRNGEVREFSIGIAAVPTGSNLVYSLSVSRIRAVGNTNIGIHLQCVRFSEVRDSEASLNSTFGILLWLDSSYNTLADNIVTGNARSGISAGCDPYTVGGSGKSSACDGKHATENVIEKNTLVYNGWQPGAPAGQSGIGLVFADRNIVRNNLVTDNHSDGPADQDVAAGIVVVAGTDNQILNNRAVNNAAGIVVTFYGDPPQYGVNTVVSGNVALANSSGGIIADGAASTGTVISGNFAASNGAASKTGFWFQCRSGICAGSDNPVLSNNLAIENAEFGIAIQCRNPTVSGNRSRGNAKPEQCSGLACK